MRENLIDLWMHACGKSEVPREFFEWSAVSLLAATMGGRAWYEKLQGSKLYPNQYIILVGPSGLGKGVAIGKASNLALAERGDGSPLIPEMIAFDIKATIQHIMDQMATIHRKSNSSMSTNVYLLMPELSSAVGTGKQAYSFVHTMVDLWEVKGRFNEGTRTHGGLVLYKPCVNWLAGSTKEWLIRSIPKDAIDSGFLARTIVVEGQYDFNRRYHRPEVPANAKEIWEHIAERLIEIAEQCVGEFYMTPEAEAIDEVWYMNREAPHDMTLAPSWKRQQDLVIKLAMSLSVADEPSGVIHAEHMQEAQKMIGQVAKSIPRLLSFASTTFETSGVIVVAEKIKASGPEGIGRSTLTKFCYNHGFSARRLDQEILPTLLGSGQVEEVRMGQGRGYIWRGRRIIE